MTIRPLLSRQTIRQILASYSNTKSFENTNTDKVVRIQVLSKLKSKEL